MKTTLHFTIALLFFLTFAFGCGQEKRPFEYRYTAKDRVVISYQGKDYQLVQFRPAPNVPFSYEFERDGDLNLTIDGKTYEIDSPYDKDKKKKKDKKKDKKKQTKKKTVKKKKK